MQEAKQQVTIQQAAVSIYQQHKLLQYTSFMLKLKERMSSHTNVTKTFLGKKLFQHTITIQTHILLPFLNQHSTDLY